jgi:hypothetical protein
VFNIPSLCDLCKPARAEQSGVVVDNRIIGCKNKCLTIVSLALGILAVLVSAALLFFSGSFVSFSLAIFYLLAMVCASAALGGSLVCLLGSSSTSISPEGVIPSFSSTNIEAASLIRSYQELLNEAEEDLKEAECLLAKKSQKLDATQKELESVKKELSVRTEKSRI